jgi:catalase
MSETPPTVIAQLVETMRALAGHHPGFRPVHAKGVVCSGTFRGTPQARSLSRALHLQGHTVATVIRFSNGSGNPDISDGVAAPRALAAKFQLSDGKSTDLLALSIEGFPARTPDEFLAFLQVQLPDRVSGQPAPDAVPRFLQSHPATRAFIERLTQRPVPASYSQTTYYAEHAFLFTAADGTSRFGRYRWVPEAGEVYLAPDDASKLSPNFLREDLEKRLQRTPIFFRLMLQLAEKGDPTNDATALWPADRSLVELGRLEITAISPSGQADERRMVFDPSNLTDGIDLSDDPILQARSAAYSISYDRRSKEKSVEN